MWFEIDDYDFDGTVDVIDPRNSRNDSVVSNALLDIRLVPGTYTGVVDTASSFAPVDRFAVVPYGTTSGGVVDDFLEQYEKYELDAVDVSSERVGIFQDKPDFDYDQWEDFFENETYPDGEYWLTRYGFCVRPSQGIGRFMAYEYLDENDQVVAIELDFR